MYLPKDHTFVLCAYKKSPYLEQCIQSLIGQDMLSNILVATSTPNRFIKELCDVYSIPLFENQMAPGIASDWNFAISCAKTPLVTIAHQDDTYEPNYSKQMLDKVNLSKKPLLFFSNYGEIRDGIQVDNNSILKVKRMMLLPFSFKKVQNSRPVRRRLLSFGSAICCPSVTMVTTNIFTPIFMDELKCNLDWQAWERVSLLDGEFLYDKSVLMHHRIHTGSETTSLIRDNTRTREDLYMFQHFWPKPIAHALVKVYRLSQKSND